MVPARHPSRDTSAAVPASETANPAQQKPAAGGGSSLPRQRQRPVATTRSRRNVVWALVGTPFALGWTALMATLGTAVLATARFLFPNVLVEPPMRFQVGLPSDYPLGTVSTKWKDSHGIWIVHSEAYKGRDQIYALTARCTHLGCIPNWLENEQKFKCPCHGSGFYVDGVNFEGPAPRPLERCGIRLAADGNLEVDKSVAFQEELGQWSNPASFVDGRLT